MVEVQGNLSQHSRPLASIRGGHLSAAGPLAFRRFAVNLTRYTVKRSILSHEPRAIRPHLDESYMSPHELCFNPADYGLPTRDDLVAYRIWDNHFHGFAAKNPIEQYEQNKFFVERMGIERSIAQEIGGTLEKPFDPYPHDAEILRILERDKDRLSGRTPIDPGFPEESCAKIEKWIRNGPCIGIKYLGSEKKGVTCSHPNNDPIMRLAAELDVHVYVHTWLQVRGTPRLPGGGNRESESTPMDLAKRVQSFRDVCPSCGHSAG